MFSQSEAYERFMGRWSRRLAPVFLEFTDLTSAESVLDVGSGTGALTSSVLATSEARQVVGVDPSAAYVDYARTRTADTRASFEVGDGQQLRFADDSFDATISLLVINFIPNPDKALSEMIRVTRPRGVVAAAVWDYDQGMEMLRSSGTRRWRWIRRARLAMNATCPFRVRRIIEAVAGTWPR